jgi:hypothetical protein
MNFAIGFTIYIDLPEGSIKALHAAHERVFAYFPHLEKKSIKIGEMHLELWGHKGMSEQTYTLPDGSIIAIIGTTHASVVWEDIRESLLSNTFEIPWDGRLILLRISADGKTWTMWNDWLGSIPVFHAEIGHGRIASTLEPVIVTAAGYTPDDFFLPGLVSLLLNGHFISDWTLYKGMKVIPPDSMMEWTENGFRAKRLWTVEPGQGRWEASWDNLVDEMHELSHQAIADVLKTQSSWILPLSAGLDSRLIAAVGADLGVNFHAYAWGELESTDVVYSRKIARTLGIPWKRIELSKDFLESYTPQWSDLFGSSMHFHGMYQMSFLDAIKSETGGSLVNGYIGDVLTGSSLMQCDSGSVIYRKDWYMHWDITGVKALWKAPIDNALQEIAEEVKKQADLIPGSPFPKALLFELWSRQRLFTSFQSMLSSYWRGVATPFINRAYARFNLSIPRAVLENRRLLGDVFRRYYGRLAVIPGTYANQPFILTGRYLLKHRIMEHLPSPLQHGPFAGFENIPLRMDIDSIQATGKEALSPLFEAKEQLSEWLDFNQLEREFQKVMASHEDIRPLRRLQSVQTLAYRLIHRAELAQ